LADVPIEVIPYTTSLPEPAARPPEARDGTGPVLFVGRLVERKGVAHLIEAIARLGGGEAAPRLEIVGDGPERPGLEALARRLGVAQRVVFRGKIPPDELQATYARAAVCVLPSVLDTRGDTEGLGVVLLEAMNHGTPVIASRVGGIPDIVEDGVSGLLVPPGDAVALAAAVRRLRDDPDLARRLGEGGRRRLREQFNWPAIVRRWLDLYAGLVTRPRYDLPRPTEEGGESSRVRSRNWSISHCWPRTSSRKPASISPTNPNPKRISPASTSSS